MLVNVGALLADLYQPYFERLRESEVAFVTAYERSLGGPLHGPWLPDRRVPIRKIRGRRSGRDYAYDDWE